MPADETPDDRLETLLTSGEAPGELATYTADPPVLGVIVALPNGDSELLEEATARWTGRFKGVCDWFDDTERVEGRFVEPDSTDALAWHVRAEWFDDLDAGEITTEELLDRVAGTVQLVEDARSDITDR